MTVDRLVEYMRTGKIKPIYLYPHGREYYEIHTTAMKNIGLHLLLYHLGFFLELFLFWFNEFYYLVSCSSEKNIKFATHP
uniref:HTH merR-type domain-containing protein n=1 Tax=Strongyloides venezuelensis TaxID=75913 RepID=A0A0K0FLU3_STRVS